MDTLLNAAVTALAQSRAADRRIPSVRRLAIAAAIAIVIAIVLTAAIGCAAAALWIWAAPRLGPAGAPLAVAAAFFLPGIVMLALMPYILRPRKQTRAIENTAHLLLSEVAERFAEHKGSALMTALLAGIAAGRQER